MQAYTHARNAAQEQKRSNPVAASEEHDLAAAEFAAAAATTTDKEALRVLKLLEAHHRQLGQILKDGHTKPNQHTTVDKLAATEENHALKEDATHANTQPPRLARTGRSTGRELSSSIASNLASARGIPSTRQKRTAPVSPLVSSDHADGTFSQDAPEQRSSTSASTAAQSSSRPSWAPPEPLSARRSTVATTSDSPFAHFYNKFESAISTLTAPLAFASLPLSEPTAPTPGPKEIDPPAQTPLQSPRKVSSKADASTASLDYSQLVSKAALRAVQDNENYQGRAPHESFLLVPTSGGTMSYADITAANYIDRQFHRQHRRDLSNASNDDFVDASSQVLPGQPGSSLLASQQFSKRDDRRLSQAQAQYQGKTLEEIHLENQTLRRTLNEAAKRIQGYEMMAQQQTIALAQSVRSLTLSPSVTPENSRGKTINPVGAPGSDLRLTMQQKRIEELEEMMRKNEKRMGKKEDENAKLKETLGKYREKWEGLKAGAKARREQAGGGERLRRGSSAAATAAAALSPLKEAGLTDDGRKSDGT